VTKLREAKRRGTVYPDSAVAFRGRFLSPPRFDAIELHEIEPAVYAPERKREPILSPGFSARVISFTVFVGLCYVMSRGVSSVVSIGHCERVHFVTRYIGETPKSCSASAPAR
jgi:hypothetical protein